MQVVTEKERLQNLAENVRRGMRRLNWSQERLAIECGVPQATISRVLNAKHDPAVSLVWHIAETLETSIDRLLSDPPPEKSVSAA